MGTQKGERALSKKPNGSKGRNDEFPKGTKVKLISGGPIMVVKGYHLFDDTIICQWFSGKKLEAGQFAPETLVLVKDDTEEKESS
jgi:uncharacterized protein YodC (DUF2158 family)